MRGPPPALPSQGLQVAQCHSSSAPWTLHLSLTHQVSQPAVSMGPELWEVRENQCAVSRMRLARVPVLTLLLVSCVSLDKCLGLPEPVSASVERTSGVIGKFLWLE